MLHNNTSTVAFSMPGGETSARARNRPVDLVHLARQTMGDRALEQEVLKMFVHQVLQMREQFAAADASGCKRLAHTLKGSARGVGAFAIGDCAAEIEEDPTNRALQRRLARLIDDVRDFVCAIDR